MTFIKFLLMLSIVNTILFTIAKLTDTRIWKVIAIEATVFVGFIFLKAWSSTFQKLANQARRLGWEFLGLTNDENGYRDALFKHHGVVARISFQRKCVFIVEPKLSGPYKDFVELERVLKRP